MKVINIKDFCIPAQDADYDELSNFADEIAELATDPIEAEPVRRGKWIAKAYPWDACSCCDTYVKGYDCWSYCPNCGARMEGEK